MVMALAMPEDRGDDSVEGHLRNYLKPANKGGLGLPLHYHPWRTHAKRATEGWPDWVIAGPRGAIVRELKTERGKPTKAQQQWLDSLERAGWDVGVWRPCCVLSHRMARELARVAGIGAP